MWFSSKSSLPCLPLKLYFTQRPVSVRGILGKYSATGIFYQNMSCDAICLFLRTSVSTGRVPESVGSYSGRRVSRFSELSSIWNFSRPNTVNSKEGWNFKEILKRVLYVSGFLEILRIDRLWLIWDINIWDGD